MENTTVARLIAALQQIEDFTAYQACDNCREMNALARDAIAEAVQNETPLAADSAVSGQEMGDEIDGSDPSQPAP